MSAGNPSYKPSEGKREEFRKYLEKNGVMDALTKVLVNLYEEVDKPEDALEYIRDKLAVIAGLETSKQLQQKITEFEDRIRELEAQLESGGGGGVAESEGAAGIQQEDQVAGEGEPQAQPEEFPVEDTADIE